MKNNIKTILILSFLMFGCEDKKSDPEVGPVPDSFTKKVLIEEFTGAWCGYCPSGAEIIELLMEENENILGVAIHSGDAMETPQAYFLETTYQNMGFPSGMVDRIQFDGYVSLNRGYWGYVSSLQSMKTAVCGLAIKSEVNGNNAAIEVHVGFNDSLQGDYRLTTYLIEDKVTGSGYGYDQVNYYDGDSTSSFYGLGDPILNYEHNNTLRSVLSEASGNQIPTSNLIPGGEFVETYTVDISSYEKSNLHVIAFVSVAGSYFTDHEIMNAQKSKINGFQDWD